MPRHEFKISILILLMGIAMVLGLGTLIFSYLEEWSLLEALYFVTVTATTVGYGDFTPTNDASRIMTIIYSLSIVPFVLYVFSVIAKVETEHVYKKLHTIENKQREHEEEIEKAEIKIKEQKHQMKEQEEELDKQQKKLKQQTKITEEQKEELDEVQDVVEDVVEDVLEKKSLKRKKERKRNKESGVAIKRRLN